jgi:hypothetical protein
MNGDTTQQSLLYTLFTMDYINWSIVEVLKEIHLQGRDYPFMSGEYTFPDDIPAGLTYTAPDYPLPLDFGSSEYVSGLSGTANHTLIVSPIDMLDKAEAVERNEMRGKIYYSDTRRRYYIRTYTPAGLDIDSFTMRYRRKPVPVNTNDDEIPFFPPNDGWEPIIIMRAAAFAKMMVTKDGWNNNPNQAYAELVRRRIQALNMETRDELVQIPMDDATAYAMSKAGEPW